MKRRIVILVLLVGSLIAAYSLGRVSNETPDQSSRERKIDRKVPERRADFRLERDRIKRESDKTDLNRDLAVLFEQWLFNDPLEALSEVRRVESLRYNAARVVRVFGSWAAEHPDAAADLLREVLDGRQADAAKKPSFLDGIDPPEFLLALVNGLGKTDPLLAGEILADAGESMVVTSAIEVLLQSWHDKDPKAVRSWAVSLASSSRRQTALAIVGQKAGQSDPQSGLTWAEELSESDRSLVIGEVVGQWSQRHSAEAFSWTEKLPDGDQKFQLMPVVLRHLTAVDPGKAADWLNQYEASPAMDESIAAYSRVILASNPPAALGSAAAISDPKKREEVVQSLTRRWMEVDPEAARKFQNSP